MPDATEEPKRLTPTTDTLRELFLKSGNQCAFPGCTEIMMNSEGVFIGQTCHIEAAERGGERFNEAMTNEQRRSFANLMLMCYPHHCVTNDVDKYPVDRLKQMKADHEARFTRAGEIIHDAILDEAEREVAHPPISLERMSTICGWDSREECIPVFNRLHSVLREVPTSTRQVLLVIVRRGSEMRHFELVQVTTRPEHEIANHIAVLESHGLVDVDLENERNPMLRLKWFGPKGGEWDMDVWNDIRKFCRTSGITLHEVIVGLRFDLLDG